jgi:hypothetical protein
MCAYVEACMHPAVYVKKLCDLTVRPSFVAALREGGKVKYSGAVTSIPAVYWA